MHKIHDSKRQMLIEFCQEPRTRAEMMERIGVNDTHYFRTYYLVPMQKEGLLRKLDLDRPTSIYQKYITVTKSSHNNI